MSGSVALSFARQAIDLLKRHATSPRATDEAGAMDFGSLLGRPAVPGRDDEAVAMPGPEQRLQVAAALPELSLLAAAQRFAPNASSVDPAERAETNALAPAFREESPLDLDPAREDRTPERSRRDAQPSDAGRSASIVADIRVETHHDPVALPRAVAPLAARMAEALPAGGVRAELPPTVEAAEIRPAAGSASGTGPASPVRVLKIELRPADLGVLHVSMRIIAGRLEVSIAATQPETVQWLEAHRESLGQALRAGGQGFEDADVLVREMNPLGAEVVAAVARSAQADAQRGVGRAVEQRPAAGEERQRVRRAQGERETNGEPDSHRGIYL
ncbi:MAG: flagellar hook-length control protein FliK [Parvibaculaceae bacterium]